MCLHVFACVCQSTPEVHAVDNAPPGYVSRFDTLRYPHNAFFRKEESLNRGVDARAHIKDLRLYSSPYMYHQFYILNDELTAPAVHALVIGTQFDYFDWSLVDGHMIPHNRTGVPQRAADDHLEAARRSLPKAWRASMYRRRNGSLQFCVPAGCFLVIMTPTVVDGRGVTRPLSDPKLPKAAIGRIKDSWGFAELPDRNVGVGAAVSSALPYGHKDFVDLPTWDPKKVHGIGAPGLQGAQHRTWTVLDYFREMHVSHAIHANACLRMVLHERSCTCMFFCVLLCSWPQRHQVKDTVEDLKKNCVPPPPVIGVIHESVCYPVDCWDPKKQHFTTGGETPVILNKSDSYSWFEGLINQDRRAFSVSTAFSEDVRTREESDGTLYWPKWGYEWEPKRGFADAIGIGQPSTPGGYEAKHKAALPPEFPWRQDTPLPCQFQITHAMRRRRHPQLLTFLPLLLLLFDVMQFAWAWKICTECGWT